VDTWNKGSYVGTPTRPDASHPLPVQRALPAPTQASLDRITRLARSVFDVERTAIAVTDGVEVWSASGSNDPPGMAPRARTFANVVAERGQPVVVDDVTDHPEYAEIEIVIQFGVRFFAGVPLRGRMGEIIGVLGLYDSAPRSFGKRDLDVLSDLAVWAEHELTTSREMVDAGRVQVSMLPPGPIRLDDWHVEGVCIPALEIGGDLYDYAATNGVIHLGLVDVMGKGTGAALLGASTRAAIRGYHFSVCAGVDLGVVATQIGQRMAADLARTASFTTMFEAAIDTEDGFMRYVDAGMGLTVIVRADGQVEVLKSEGLPLGVFLDTHWDEQHTTLEPGDRLLTFTDGLLDLVDSTNWSEPIGRLVAEHADVPSLLATISDLARAVDRTDDVTALAVFRAPPEAAR
jgi:phosphoserine phosphatase RsbU/P